jgi:hypothetical protein
MRLNSSSRKSLLEIMQSAPIDQIAEAYGEHYINLTRIQKLKVFDVRASELEKVNYNLFWILSQHLEEYKKNYSIPETFVYFKEKEKREIKSDVNETGAFVYFTHNYIEDLLAIPVEYQGRLGELPLVKKLIDLKVFEFPPERIISEMQLLFLFHHEMGHVIQESGNHTEVKQKHLVYKNKIGRVNYDHVVEWDADEFSSVKLSQQLIAYWDAVKEKKKSQELMEMLITFAIIGHFLVLHDFYRGEKWYAFDKEHPHATFRTFGVATLMINYINSQNRVAKLDTSSLINKAMGILKEWGLSEVVDEHYKNLNDDFLEYYEKLKALRLDFPFSATRVAFRERQL